MTKTMGQVLIRASEEEIKEIDQLAYVDGYATRSSWIRHQLRKVLSNRQTEIVSVTSLPHPEGGAIVPVVTIRVAE